MKKRFSIGLLVLVLGSLCVLSLGWILNFLSPVTTKAPGETSTEYSEWRLVVDGFVRLPLNLTLNELAAMPRSTVSAELYCVDYPETVRAKGNWTGVRLGLVLEKALIQFEAVKAAFYADDGYSTDLTVTTAMREDVILAYEKDGEPLSEKLRLVVPGKWGYKWIGKVTRIELVNYDFKGFWESRGYPDEADIPSSP